MNINFPSDCDIIKNKYYKWYCSIITKRLSSIPVNQYTEKHHIIPTSIDKYSKNTVKLTAREHFIVHLLLPKFINTIEFKLKLIFALWGICNQKSEDQKRVKINSKIYSQIKLNFSKSISGESHWMKDPARRKHLSELKKGVKLNLTPEQKEKKSQQSKSLLRTEKWKNNISKANKGKKRTEEMCKKMSDRMKEEFKTGKRQTNSGKKCLKYNVNIVGKNVQN